MPKEIHLPGLSYDAKAKLVLSIASLIAGAAACEATGILPALTERSTPNSTYTETEIKENLPEFDEFRQGDNVNTNELILGPNEIYRSDIDLTTCATIEKTENAWIKWAYDLNKPSMVVFCNMNRDQDKGTCVIKSHEALPRDTQPGDLICPLPQ